MDSTSLLNKDNFDEWFQKYTGIVRHIIDEDGKYTKKIITPDNITEEDIFYYHFSEENRVDKHYEKCVDVIDRVHNWKYYHGLYFPKINIVYDKITQKTYLYHDFLKKWYILSEDGKSIDKEEVTPMWIKDT